LSWLAVDRFALASLFSATASSTVSAKERLQHVRYQCCGFEPSVFECVSIDLKALSMSRQLGRDARRVRMDLDADVVGDDTHDALRRL
jgi:hypothetical protein